jgi:hypothetical protein
MEEAAIANLYQKYLHRPGFHRMYGRVQVFNAMVYLKYFPIFISYRHEELSIIQQHYTEGNGEVTGLPYEVL